MSDENMSATPARPTTSDTTRTVVMRSRSMTEASTALMTGISRLRIDLLEARE